MSAVEGIPHRRPVVRKSRVEEEIVTKTIGTGRWQWLLVALLSLMAMPYASNAHSSLFFCPPAVRFWCRPPSDMPPDALDRWLLLSHPYTLHTYGDNADKKCVYYNATYAEWTSGNYTPSPLELVPCREFVFSHELHGVTMFEDFGLVCNDEYLVRRVQMTYDAGLVLGSLLIGYLIDRFGRKTPLFALLSLQAVVGLGVAYGTKYSVVVLLRLLYGAAVGGGFVVTYVLLVELVENKRRSLACGMLIVTTSLGYLFLPLMNLLLDDWKKQQAIISGPTVFFLIFIGFVPESPAWLLTNNDPLRATKVLRRAALVNGQRLPSTFRIRSIVMLPNLHRPNLNLEGDNLWHVCQYNNVVKLWIGLSVLFFGVEFTMRLIVVILCTVVIKQMTIAMIIASVMGIFAFLIGLEGIHRFGHHKMLCCTIIATALVLAIAQAFQFESRRTLDQPKVILLCVALMFAAMAYCVVYNYGSRAYPTKCRGGLFGCTLACASLGQLGAPAWILDMDAAQHVPILIVCSVLPFTCVSLFWIPTVHLRELPDALLDAHNFRAQPKPQRWTTTRPQSVTVEELEIRNFDMERGEQPEGLDFSVVQTPARLSSHR